MKNKKNTSPEKSLDFATLIETFAKKKRFGAIRLTIVYVTDFETTFLKEQNQAKHDIRLGLLQRAITAANHDIRVWKFLPFQRLKAAVENGKKLQNGRERKKKK